MSWTISDRGLRHFGVLFDGDGYRKIPFYNNISVDIIQSEGCFRFFAVPFAMPVESHFRRMERFEIESDHLFLCSKLWKSSMYECSSGVVAWVTYCVRTFSFKT